MSDESSPEDIRAGFAEACNLARHYSTLRFVMFSVFITIIGALVAVEFDSTRRPVGKPLDLFRVGSFCLVMSFMVSEWRIGQLVKFYQKATYEFGARNGRTSLAVAMPPANAFWFGGSFMGDRLNLFSRKPSLVHSDSTLSSSDDICIRIAGAPSNSAERPWCDARVAYWLVARVDASHFDAVREGVCSNSFARARYFHIGCSTFGK